MGKRNQTGSAMVIAMVIVLILATVAAVLMTEVVFRYKQTDRHLTDDQAMVICRAGLERARRQLYLYRTTKTWDPAASSPDDDPATSDYVSQWNSIVDWCDPGNNATSAANWSPDGGTTQIPMRNRVFTTNLLDIRANYEMVKTNVEFTSYRINPSAPSAATSPGGSGEAPPKPASVNTEITGVSPPPPLYVVFGQNKPFLSGGYHVILHDNMDGDDDLDTDGDGKADAPGADGVMTDSDSRAICTVTATLEDGTQRQIEATLFFTPPVYTTGGGYEGEGPLGINGGSGAVNGAMGNVSANGDITLTGSGFTISRDLTSAGTINGTANVGGTVTSGAPPKVLPVIDPVPLATASPSTTWTFYSDGSWRDTGGVVHAMSDPLPGAVNEFNYTGGEWKLSGGSNPDNGYIFVFEGNFTMTGAGGAGPLEAAFISTGGSIDMGGNRTLVPLSSGPLAGVQAVAYGDLVARGTSGVLTLEGLWAARGQVEVQGTADLKGSVLVNNVAGAGNLVADDANKLAGNISITCDTGVTTPFAIASSVTVDFFRKKYPGDE